MKAPRNKPSLFPSFATSCKATDIAPADSPQLDDVEVSACWRKRDLQRGTYMVTFLGSPPKAEMYFWIHFSARRSEMANVNVCRLVAPWQACTDGHATQGCQFQRPQPLFREESRLLSTESLPQTSTAEVRTYQRHCETRIRSSKIAALEDLPVVHTHIDNR